MTVQTTQIRALGTGNGVADTFPYGFKILDKADLLVVLQNPADYGETTLILGTDYDVTGAGADAGGDVVFTVPPPNLYGVSIRRNTPLTQPTDLKNQSAYYPRTVESALDRATLQIQQLDAAIDRALKLPAAFGGSGELPANLAGKLLSFDAGGLPIAIPAAGGTLAPGVGLSNTGPGVGLFYQVLNDVAFFKTLIPLSGNLQLVDMGAAGIGIDAPGGPAASNFDIPYTGHVPAGNVHWQSPRGSVARYSAAAAGIQSVTLQTPWPADATELKADLEIRLRAQPDPALAVDGDRRRLYMQGMVQLNREGNNWVANTPAFVGECSSGFKIMVGTIGGLIAVQITYLNGAADRLREVSCIVSGVSYCESNTDQLVVVAADAAPPALTGPTPCYGASGIVPFVCIGATTILSATNWEHRGSRLYMQGAILAAPVIANNAVLFNLPAPFRPRTTTRRSMDGQGTLKYCAASITAAGDVVLSTDAAGMSGLYFNQGTGLHLGVF